MGLSNDILKLILKQKFQKQYKKKFLKNMKINIFAAKEAIECTKQAEDERTDLSCRTLG